MNVQKLFSAVKAEADQHTLIVAANELERQGYKVVVAEKYNGSVELCSAEEKGELKYLSTRNGVKIKIKKKNEIQVFRIHFLDIDIIAITDLAISPIKFDEENTADYYKKGLTN
jgi:hypothetical protein